jgi:tetrahydromethanopterin S-methyltransferase subunit G
MRVEIRMAHLEGAYEQVSQRLNGIDRRLENLEQKVDATRDMLLARIDHLDQKFLWVIGLVLVSILLPLVQRFVSHA